eukprot:5706538-Pleurochrysis_carterae.AAC.1
MVTSFVFVLQAACLLCRDMTKRGEKNSYRYDKKQYSNRCKYWHVRFIYGFPARYRISTQTGKVSSTALPTAAGFSKQLQYTESIRRRGRGGLLIVERNNTTMSKKKKRETEADRDSKSDRARAKRPGGVPHEQPLCQSVSEKPS